MTAFNVNDLYTAIIAIIGSAPVTGWLIKKFGKPATDKIEEAVRVDGPILLNALKDAGQVVEDLAKLPELAMLKAKVAAEAKAIKASELDRVASIALHAYEKGFNSLSANEKGTLITLARTELAKVHIYVTDSEIVAAVLEAQKLADVFKDTESFRMATALDASLKALVDAPASRHADSRNELAKSRQTDSYRPKRSGAGRQ